MLNRYNTWNRQKPSMFLHHYLCHSSNSGTSTFAYIDVNKQKEYAPELRQVPPETGCILSTFILVFKRLINITDWRHTYDMEQKKIFCLYVFTPPHYDPANLCSLFE